jgi:hypothetical protein
MVERDALVQIPLGQHLKERPRNLVAVVQSISRRNMAEEMIRGSCLSEVAYILWLCHISDMECLGNH